jgi:hypothetical protein
LMMGCSPEATGGVDACPTASTICAQRASDAPLFVCYERCTPGVACRRSVEGYSCGGAGEPPNICLSTQGS